MQGADNPVLEAKIKEHYESVGWDGEFQSGVKVAHQTIQTIQTFLPIDPQQNLFQGMIELNTFVSAQGTECLNEDDEHPYSGCLHAGRNLPPQTRCKSTLLLNSVELHYYSIHRS